MSRANTQGEGQDPLRPASDTARDHQQKNCVMINVLEVKKRRNRLLGQIKLAAGQKEVEVPEAKRACWRYRWVVPGTIVFVDSKDSSRLLFITTSTISAEGLDFRSPRILEPGCKVLITLETDEGQMQIPATVTHSTESVGMPIVGVAFDLD